MELSTELVYAVGRKQYEGQRLRITEYGLYCDRTTHGGGFYFVKAHSQLWDGLILVRENVDTAGGMGSDRAQALSTFARLCEALKPVLPEHLSDVIHDLTCERLGERRRGRRQPGRRAAGGAAGGRRAGARKAGDGGSVRPSRRARRRPRDIRTVRVGSVVYLDSAYRAGPGAGPCGGSDAGPGIGPDRGPGAAPGGPAAEPAAATASILREGHGQGGPEPATASEEGPESSP